MHPTETLSAEHRVILRVLACLERIVDGTGPLDGGDARKAVEFLQTFADHCHHAKEEKCLFPKLEERGLPAEEGPLFVMRHEHDVGRAHVRAMLDLIDGAIAGEADCLTAFTNEARGFVDLLRQHIRKEDHILFPMAASFLKPEDADVLAAQFEAAETGHPPGTHARMLAIADELVEKYGVDTAQAEAMSRPMPGSCF